MVMLSASSSWNGIENALPVPLHVSYFWWHCDPVPTEGKTGLLYRIGWCWISGLAELVGAE